VVNAPLFCLDTKSTEAAWQHFCEVQVSCQPNSVVATLHVFVRVLKYMLNHLKPFIELTLVDIGKRGTLQWIQVMQSGYQTVGITE
jgi:hypothetical protein